MNEATYVTNQEQFVSTFGAPMTGVGAVPYATHAGIQFLREGSQLWFVRIESGSNAAVASSANVLDSNAGVVFSAAAATAGTWGNYTTSGTFVDGLQVTITDPLDSTYNSTRFRLIVVFKGQQVESFDNLTWASSSDANYFTTRVNGVSQYLTLAVGGASNKPANTTYNLSGGTNGTTGLADADYIGTATSVARTGLQIFEDKDLAEINILAIPGASRTVMQAGVAMAELRQDCMMLIDPPVGMTSVAAVRNWANGTDGSGNSFNSSFAAVYWPWIEYFDNYSGQYVWTPPSGWIAGVVALTDKVAEPWFAPAGLVRGILKTANRIEYSPTFGERELLANPGEIVNPIVKKAGYGIVVWGQHTAQRITSALDRINVRRMLILAEKTIAKSIEFLVFEPNDPVTWRRFTNIVNPVLASIQARRGLEQFQVICDASTNTNLLRDQNTMRGILLLKPTKTAEVINLDFVLTSAGASFSEVLSSVA